MNTPYWVFTLSPTVLIPAVWLAQMLEPTKDWEVGKVRAVKTEYRNASGVGGRELISAELK